MTENHWISTAIEHSGYLTRFAREHGTVDADGKINVLATKEKARELGNSHALRAVDLLATLNRVRP